MQMRPKCFHGLGRRGSLHPMRGFAVLHIGLFAKHILRQGKHHRTRASAKSDVKSPADVFRNSGRAIDLRHPFCHFSIHTAEIDFLKGFPVHHRTFYLTNEENHGSGILKGRVDSDRGVRGTRPAGHQTHSRTTGQFGRRLGHICRPSLVSGCDHLNRVPVFIKPVQQLEKTFTRQTENTFHSLDFELIG